MDPGTDSEVIQSCFPALLGQSTVCENWLKVSLVGCRVDTGDSPFNDETIEKKTAGREPWKGCFPCAIHNTVLCASNKLQHPVIPAQMETKFRGQLCDPTSGITLVDLQDSENKTQLFRSDLLQVTEPAYWGNCPIV